MRIKTLQRGQIHLSLAVLTCLPLATANAADGDLDPSFVPDPDYVFNQFPYYLEVIDSRLYYQLQGQPIHRLREDGTKDPAWNLPITGITGGSRITQLRSTAWGGWILQTAVSLYSNPGSGPSTRHTYSFGNGGSAFPQDDGSLLMPNPVGRLNPDGVRDPRFGKGAGFEITAFNDQAGRIISGGAHPTVAATIDRQRRMIIGGNFKRVGALDRLALVRILSDGEPDPSWNPGLELGIELDMAGYISALPYAIVLGPDDSVVVGLQLVSTTGHPTFSFAVIDASGTVTAAFAAPELRTPTAPVVQPDGKILIGGTIGPSTGDPLEAVRRFAADGTPDSTFNVGLDFASGTVSVRKLSLDEHGRLWFDGYFDTVNGVAHPGGLARVLAYDPTAAAPQLDATSGQLRIATNEALQLTAAVEGYPPPTLQWFLDGVALTGQTNRGLRIHITDPAQVGTFKLVATNDEGAQELTFPMVALAERSPRPGSLDPHFERSLPEINDVMHLLPLADGSVFVGGGDSNDLNAERRAMVGRLTSEPFADTTFGEDGFVWGNGIVETLVLLSAGGLMVVGSFTELGGIELHGLAMLDATGQVLELDYPVLDDAHVTAALPLPDGRFIIAGYFQTLNQTTVSGLARLDESLALDASFVSPLDPNQVGDDLKLDGQGRLLIAGERFAHIGLQRLLEDGGLDPTFQPYSGPVRKVFVEPAGTLLAGLPPRRFDGDGQLLVEFEQESGIPDTDLRAFDADHRLIRLVDGSVVGPKFQATQSIRYRLMRWSADGLRNYEFETLIGGGGQSPTLRAACLLPDDSILLSVIDYGSVGQPTPPPELARRLIRVPMDSDSRLKPVGVSAGEFRVQLDTQPGRAYEVRRRTSLDSPASEVVTDLDGDGYVRDISTAADQPMLFLELRRQ